MPVTFVLVTLSTPLWVKMMSPAEAPLDTNHHVLLPAPWPLTAPHLCTWNPRILSDTPLPSWWVIYYSPSSPPRPSLRSYFTLNVFSPD